MMTTSRRIVLLLSFAVVCLATLSVYEGWRRMPYNYSLVNPESLESRRILLSKVSRDLQSLEGTTSGSQPYLNDPDSLWPQDRLRVVKAIETYYLKNRKLPSSLDALIAEGVLPASTIRDRHRLETQNGRWELRTREANYLFAFGN